MNCRSKLSAIGLVAVVVGVATPAFAQALQTGSAANREQLYDSSQSQFVPYYGRQTDRANGLGAYAEASGAATARPGQAAMAGGSIGYNSHNETRN
jgi:hypothetical protein